MLVSRVSWAQMPFGITIISDSLFVKILFESKGMETVFEQLKLML